MDGLAMGHDSMTFEWNHQDVHLGDQALFEALEHEHALATACTTNLPDPLFESAIEHEPIEDAQDTILSLDEVLAQQRSRTRHSTIPSPRSSSTVKPYRSDKWYRRWHTENTGAMFTLGGSSSESELSEVEKAMDGIENLEQILPSTTVPSGSRNGSHSEHVTGLDAITSYDVQDDSNILNNSEEALLQYIHADNPTASSRSLLSTVGEEAHIDQVDVFCTSQRSCPPRNIPPPLKDSVDSSASHESRRAYGAPRTTGCWARNATSPDGHSSRNIRKTWSRLPAELQLHMSDSRLDESDNSWTEADDQQEWYTELQAQLASFRRQNSRISLITTLLDSSQRKQVHAMAKMMGLSHVSLGKEKLRRLLLTKCELAQTFSSMPPNKRWISHRHHWISGWADPRLIMAENIFWTVPESEVESHISDTLTHKHTTSPLQTVIVRQEHRAMYAAYMFFKTPEAAASAILALDNDVPEWNGWPLGCEYVRLPGNSRVIEAPLDLNRLARAAMHLWLAEQDCSDLPSYEDLPTSRSNPSQLSSPMVSVDTSIYNHITSDGQQSFEGDSLPPTSFMESVPMARMASDTSTSSETFSSNLGQASLGANTSMTSMGSIVLSDYGSEASVAKKRKRQPVTQAGYKCSNAGCDKSFDRAGDLRKHEKVHSLVRPHHCAVCGQGFLYPKDLRRHRAKKGHAQLGDELANVPEEAGLFRSLSCSAI